MRHVLRLGMLWAAWFGLWLLLVEKLTADELLVGVACALVAALASTVAWGDHLTSFVANPRLLAQAWRLPLIFATGTFEIFAVLARHLFTSRKADSLLLVVPFDAGAEDDGNATARRALAIAYTTMTPNFVILGIDHEKGLMLYHQIKKSSVPVMTQKLGARP